MSLLPKTEGPEQLYPLSEEELAQLQLPLHEIWYLMINEVPTGPFSFDNLKNFLKSHLGFDRQTLACHGEEGWWRPLREYTFFHHPQKLQEVDSLVVSPEQLDEIMLMISGQPCGPYTRAQVDRQLQGKEILLTNLSSMDEGKSWHKLYEHPAFSDRKNLFQKELPFMPKGQLFFSRVKEREGLQTPPPLLGKRDSLRESQEGLSKLINLIRGKGFLRGGPCAQETSSMKSRFFVRKGALIMVAAMALSFCFYKFNQQKLSLPSSKVKFKKINPSSRPSRPSISRTPRAVRPLPSPSVQSRPEGALKAPSPSPPQGPRPSSEEDKDIPEDKVESSPGDLRDNEDIFLMEEAESRKSYGEEVDMETIEGEEFLSEES